MKLVTLSAAFFPNLNAGKMFLLSAERNGLDVRVFGQGEPYCIWADMKIIKKIPVLQGLAREGFTHVLYSDFRDVIVLRHADTIMGIYKAVGTPSCFVSAEPNCNPNKDYASLYPETGTSYRFPSPGGYLAELPWIIDKFERMAKMRDRSGDDSEIWQWAWAEGWFRPVVDEDALIWQTFAGVNQEIRINGDRLLNTATGSQPCILHIQGGYSDPKYGKFETMKPYWDALYPDMPISREEVVP